MTTTEDNTSSAFEQAASGSLTGMIEAASHFSAIGQPALARQIYQAWIECNPGHPQLCVAHFNCSALDSQAGDRAAAAASLNNAIAQNPDFIPAYINLGRIFEDSGAPERAVELWRQAVSRNAPINGSAILYAITALTQIARVLTSGHRSEETEDAIRQCLDINPRQPEILEQYTAVRLAQCKWPAMVPSDSLDRKSLLGGINPLSMAAYTDDPLLQLASGYRYVKRSAWDGKYDPQTDRRHAAIDPGRRIRIGYVSSDLRDHAIGYLMAELFELHNRRDVEVFAYYCGPESNSALTHRIKAAVEHWRDIRTFSDEEAARLAAADGIDILVDINGHTRDAKTGMFARRPAPIQVNWLGYPGSMGSPYHQYIVADDWIIPPGSEMYYSEKVLRLPCYQPNDRKRVIAAEKPNRADAGLPENGFVFCCFNGTHKISRFTFERWLEILARVEGSVLWLLDTSEPTKARLREFAEKNGVAASRIVFAAKMANPQHLARYPLADLFLDSVPYGAHTTASDALWMGVPVLTLSGRSFASRVCGSLVRSAGLPDLVCTRPEEYVERAAWLGNNRAEVESRKARLKANRDTCQLFDTNRLASCLENLYRSMCDEHRNGRVPQPDLTNLDAYFEVGCDHDHDAEEAFKVADYHGMYKAKLRRLHLARPLAADARLWHANDIAAADAPPMRGLAPSAGEIAMRLLQARILHGQGKILECLEALLALKGVVPDKDSLLDDVRAVIGPTIQRFNEFAAGGNIEQAAKYADALAALLPGNPAVLNSALSCSVALGRKPQAERYSATIAGIDAAQTAAPPAVPEFSDPAVPETIAPVPPAVENPIHPLIRLRDLYDQASSILCGALTQGRAEQVGQLLDAARHLDVDVPKDSEWAGWEKHYRLAMEAADPSVALGPTPEASLEPKIVFTTSSGKPLDWRGVQAAAKSLKAEAVFFAAADKAYVDLYARPYIRSILEHSDVPSLVILHVIGGARELARVAKSVGVTSNRVIFAGDNFDAGSVATRCYDAPPKGLSANPIAHLQSVRFLRLGRLLKGLKLPVFVSDIDLILQRGVEDLLAKFADHDVVLNENTNSENAGSRFTANLLLLNPTRNAALFLRFLRGYLENALSGSEVTRWIDQFALLQARHHLLSRQPGARIGCFDTDADINNVMYTSYREHPFRFLSLYHGFDMTSLPGKPQARAGKPAPAKKAPPRATAPRTTPRKRAAGGARA